MKKWIWIITALLPIHISNAQQPALAGDWRIEQHRVQFSGNEDGPTFFDGVSEGLDIEIFPDHRFSVGPDIGRWIFSNDYLLAIQETSIDRLALNEGGDSFAFASTNFNGTPSDFIRESGLSVALKRPITDLTSSQVSGNWALLRQSIEFSEIDEGGSTSSTLHEVNHTRTNINLVSNGTLEAETILDTENPENEGSMLNGTWAMTDGEFSAVVSGDTISRPNLSSGADLMIHTQQDSLEDGSETLFASAMEIWIKSPDTLNLTDVVGSWGLAGIITEVLSITGSSALELQNIEIQEARIEIRADGTGTVSNLNRSGIPQRDPDQDFTWTIESGEIVVRARDEFFRFTMSAGKDFAVLLKSSRDSDSGVHMFNLFALSKLPDVPGFSADAANGSLAKAPGANPEVVLTIQSITGIPYQVEESAKLDEWMTRTAPILGTGEEITSSFEAISNENRFYRWKLLPLGEAP